MEGYGDEIKQGKYIDFKSKNQRRFTRTKTIGVNYTEERIKDRILNEDKELGNIIDIKNNDKAKASRGYERWATKHNLQTVSQTMILIHERGFDTVSELQKELARLSHRKGNIGKNLMYKEFQEKRIKEITSKLQICIAKKAHYDGYKKNPSDKNYFIMNKKILSSINKP